jgi:hypothetical protein
MNYIVFTYMTNTNPDSNPSVAHQHAYGPLSQDDALTLQTQLASEGLSVMVLQLETPPTPDDA